MTLWDGRLTFEVSSADPDSDTPVWVDLTLRMRDAVRAIELNTGRQTDLAGGEPGVFTVVLDNSDDALTYGNTTSPYAAWWGPGRKCRLRETIAGVVMDRATGYLQTPTEQLATVGMEHRVTLSIVDRLGRFASSDPFISTLAAYIIYSGGSALKAYYPLGEAVGPSYRPAVAASSNYPTLLEQRNLVSLPATSASLNHFSPGTGSPIARDDLAQIQFSPQVGIISAPTFSALASTTLTSFVSGVTFGPGTILTVACWVSPDPTLSVDGRWEPLTLSIGTGLGGGLIRIRRTDSTESPPNVWKVAFIDTILAGWSFEAYAAHSASKPTLLAVRIDPGANTMTLYVDGVAYAATPTGTLPSTMLLGSITVGTGPFIGTIGHVQIYESTGTALYAVGPQRDAAWLALERQSTGDRIATIAAYAGVRGGEMFIDTGTSIMQKASLAGQNALDALHDAERTEQGLLTTDGSGNLIFKDRKTLYNI